MWNATIKGLLSHKLRLALTALAIVLGVSFVSGTYVLTDTMNATFSQLFKDTTNGFAQFIGKNGKAVTTGGAPTLGVSASEAPELNSNFTMRSGRIPAGPNEVDVVAQPGVTPEQLRDRIAGAVPSKYESITGADQAQRSAKEIQDGLGF